MKRYFLAHDIGTSCDKAVLVDPEGRVFRTVSQGYPIHFGPQQAEQDPEDWWRAFCISTRKLLADVRPEQILAVAVSGQMMACLPVDRAGRALRPAMIWADARAARQTEEIVAQVGAETYYRTTGMRPSANYALSKMRWFRQQEPRLYAQTFCFLAAKDYVNHRLTGVFATDREDAAYMHAYDIVARDWSGALLQAAGIERDKMPPIREQATVLGTTGREQQRETGLAPGTPVVLCAGDGDMATLGAGVVEVGDAYTSVGTSSWVSVLTGSPRMDGRQRIAKADCFGLWRDSGTMQAGGFSYSWFRNLLCESEANAGDPAFLAQLEARAEASPPGAGGVLYLPYLMGERSPWWDNRLRGAFLGLQGDTTRGDMARAVLEGVALNLGLIYDVIRETVPEVQPQKMRLIGGGGKSRLWRQIFADVYGLPVVQTNVSEQAGALGCAVLAGIALGMYRDRGVIREIETIQTVTEPDPQRTAFYRDLRGLFAKAAQAVAPVSHWLGEQPAGETR